MTAATTTYPISKISQLRRQAQKLTEMPEDLSDGWMKSPIDPMQLLGLFRTSR